SYTPNNYISTIITQYYINDEWQDNAKRTYLYDINNNLTEDILSSDYFDSTKFLYEYDENNNGIKGGYYAIYGDEWANGQSNIEMYYNNMQSTYNDTRQCCLITISYTKTPKPAGIEEIEPSTSEIAIYPNPSKDYINISVENDKIENVEIYNITGKLVKQEKSNKININDLPVGIYLIKVETNWGKTTEKLVIE
ncbi:MAG: T9SS type A sorting domain-containing protein, partial [Bacteroidales bacterium]|nr:T9SS type A sorting domain-containing protein [Bacteroidales bacterium]